MINKFEYSDLYKFLTSLGLIIMALAFIIPWLFLKSDVGLMISKEEYNNLIETSKNLTDQRINLSNFIIRNIKIIFGTLMLVGTCITLIGLFNWIKKQKKLNKKEDKEFEILTGKQVKDKAVSEIEEDEDFELNQNDKANKETLVSNLISLENLLFTKFIDADLQGFEVRHNIKIKDHYTIDILLESLNNSKQNRDVLVEVKYLQNKLDIDIVENSYFNFNKKFNNYISSTRTRYARMIFILVYNKDIPYSKDILVLKKNYMNFIDVQKSGRSNVDFFLMNNEEVKMINIKDIF